MLMERQIIVPVGRASLQRGMERLALGISTILYDDIRDTLLDFRRHMTQNFKVFNWRGIIHRVPNQAHPQLNLS